MKGGNASIRCAVIGAGRGRTFIRSAQAGDAGIVLAGICDTQPEALAAWSGVPGLKFYAEFNQVLHDPDIDAVCLATPVPLHAGQAIAALEAGKHVLSEVTAACTLDECHALVAAVETSGLTYMMAENYCFIDAVLQVQHMVEQGVFGELTYASGSYLHDCRQLYFDPAGELTWRGVMRRDIRANSYPTHSIGPVARWLGINRTDRFATTATWHGPSRAASHHARERQPGRAAYSEPAFWNHPDTVTTCIRTENGVLIDLRVDWASARPHHMTRYELQGTRAAFCWPDGRQAEPLVWIEGRSPSDPHGAATDWEPLANYRAEFEHPLWREHRAAAASTGHGGGDYFVLREFAAAIREQRRPLIDVYDAVTWSCLTPLSERSIAAGNIPVPVPDFRKSLPKYSRS